MPSISLLGQRVHALSEADCVDHVLHEIGAGRGGWILTPNVDILRKLALDPEVRALCAGATLVVPDGMPLIWASRLKGEPLPERVAGSSLISTLSDGAADRGFSVFLLGGLAGTAERAAAELLRRRPDLEVAGTWYPPPGFERDPTHLSSLGARLDEARPDLVFVALGCPRQERVIARYRKLLPGAFWMGVGISFSYLAGDVRRSPFLLRRIGLEWLFRLAQEPGRLARRYLIDDLPFVIRLLAASGADRFRRPRGERLRPPSPNGGAA